MKDCLLENLKYKRESRLYGTCEEYNMKACMLETGGGSCGQCGWYQTQEEIKSYKERMRDNGIEVR